MRPSRSALPPAAKGTISLIGLEGQSLARPAPGPATKSNSNTASMAVAACFISSSNRQARAIVARPCPYDEVPFGKLAKQSQRDEHKSVTPAEDRPCHLRRRRHRYDARHLDRPAGADASRAQGGKRLRDRLFACCYHQHQR